MLDSVHFKKTQLGRNIVYDNIYFGNPETIHFSSYYCSSIRLD